MKEVINNLVKKYKTNNPFDIAKSMGAIILFDNIGDCNGFCLTINRQCIVYINNNLPNPQQRLTMAHELGHMVLHKGYNTPFLKQHTHLLVNKMEIEANKFAMHLLINDNDLEEYRDYTIQQLSMIFGYPIELIKLRLL